MNRFFNKKQAHIISVLLLFAIMNDDWLEHHSSESTRIDFFCYILKTIIRAKNKTGTSNNFKLIKNRTRTSAIMEVTLQIIDVCLIFFL